MRGSRTTKDPNESTQIFVTSRLYLLLLMELNADKVMKSSGEQEKVANGPQDDCQLTHMQVTALGRYVGIWILGNEELSSVHELGNKWKPTFPLNVKALPLTNLLRVALCALYCTYSGYLR